MHAGYRFSELSNSLRNGFLADQIVLTLAKAERGDPISEAERNSLRNAVALFEAAVEGHNWLDNPELTDSSTTFAASFSRAIEALPDVNTSKDFLEHMTELRRIAVDLSEGRTPEKEKIGALRKFFFKAASSELTKTEELLKGESSSDAFLRWTAIKE